MAPLTSTIRDIPSEVVLSPEEDGVPALCAANLDNAQTVAKQKIGRLITTLSRERMVQTDRAVCFALGIDLLNLLQSES